SLRYRSHLGPSQDTAIEARVRGMIDRVRFVLVRPEEPENVGAAARVMRNFGFGDLVLVEPRLGRPERAYVVAHRAEDIVLAATHVSRLDEALEGCVRAF